MNFEQVQTVAGRLLLRGPSKRLLYSFIWTVNLIVYLCSMYQCLESLIQGLIASKLGLVKISPKTHNHFLRYGLSDSLFQLFSGFLTLSQCFLVNQRPSWKQFTAVHVSAYSYASQFSAIKQLQTLTRN
jgi:hypothetical protein